MTSERLDLDAIRARAAAATEGPWDGWSAFSAGGGGYLTTSSGMYDLSPGAARPSESEWRQADRDATFIAHAREDVPALVAEVETLRARVAELDSVPMNYCPVHGDLLSSNRSARCAEAPEGHERGAGMADRCGRAVGRKPAWMGADQWGQCYCILDAGHEGPCECRHEVDDE